MADISIRAEELDDQRIDEVINLEKSLSRSTGEFVEDVKTPFYLNPVFYYGLAGLLGTISVWSVWEPLVSDDNMISIPFVSSYILFGPVGAILGLALGLTYGLANHNLRQAFYCGIVGVGIGIVATLVTTVLANILFGITTAIAVASIGENFVPEEGVYPFHGLSFYIFMCGRGLAWSIVSMGAGLGLGIALKSKKLLLNGLVGGMVGGMLGGLFFDPIERFITPGATEATVSRGVAFAVIGLLVGIFIGIFENLSKESWFLMVKGPLAGKQFNIFKSPMMIGSAPKCDIYLFKDPAVDPQHASITKSGNKYLLKDEGSRTGTFVNGRQVDRFILQADSVVTIGETVLRYGERQRR